MKILLIALLLLSLSGCSLFQTKPLEVSSVPVDRAPLVLPEVDEYAHNNVNWIVITPDNAIDVWKRLRKNGDNIVLIGVTDQGYKNLSLNNANLLKIMQQYKAVIATYKEYYEPEKSNSE